MNAALYVVSCPIGNIEDITLRALSVLKTADIIVAEDTRNTLQLLRSHNIPASGRLISCHEHNEINRAPDIIRSIQQGKSVALVTDAGTPSVSDPGFPVIREAVQNDINIVPVPGASAVLAALASSGLPTDSFIFAGFMPKKKGKQKQRLEELANEPATLIFYESPRRIANFINMLFEVMGDRQAVVCREMTKKYEEFIRGSLAELVEIFNNKKTVKGEIAVVVEGATPTATALSDDLLKKTMAVSSCGVSELAKILAVVTGSARRDIYEALVRLKG